MNVLQELQRENKGSGIFFVWMKVLTYAVSLSMWTSGCSTVEKNTPAMISSFSARLLPAFHCDCRCECERERERERGSEGGREQSKGRVEATKGATPKSGCSLSSVACQMLYILPHPFYVHGIIDHTNCMCME